MTGDAASRNRPAGADAGPLRVTQLVTTLARGGAQATVLASADMADLGIEVRVLAGADDRGEGTLWSSPAARRADLVAVPSLVRRVAPGHDLATLWWLIRRLRADRPDVLHTHSTKAGILGRLAAAAVGVPSVHTVHGWGPLHAAGRWSRPLIVLLERALARLTTALVVVGTADRRTGLTLGIGHPCRYRLIRSGVDLPTDSGADRCSLRAHLGLEDRFVVGMVARLSPPKDHDTLLAAFARAAVPGSVLILVGDGPERQRLERRAAEVCPAGEVRFLGEREDAARLVAAFDVAVLCSRWEGLPRTVVEAAAARVPVVATDVGSVSDLIEDGVSGRLVRAGDVAGLAASLRSVADPEGDPRWPAMIEEAARRATAFSTSRMRADLAELWFEVAGVGRDVIEPATAPAR